MEVNIKNKKYNCIEKSILKKSLVRAQLILLEKNLWALIFITLIIFI